MYSINFITRRKQIYCYIHWLIFKAENIRHGLIRTDRSGSIILGILGILVHFRHFRI